MAQELIDKIRAAAQASNIDPDVAVRIAQVESSLNPAAQAKTSTAKGLFQVVDSTWKQYGGKPGQQKNPDENIRVGMNILADNTSRLRSALGREPSASELYAAHFFGASAAPAVLSASPDTPISELLSQRAVRANPQLQGKTAGEVRQMLQDKMGQPLAPAKAQPSDGKEGQPDFEAIGRGQMTADLGSGYKAALALSFLGDEEDSDEKKLDEEEKQAAKQLADYKSFNALEGLDFGPTVVPLMPQQTAQAPDQVPVQRLAAGGMPFVPTAMVRPSIRQQLTRAKADFDRYNAEADAYNKAAEAYNAGPRTEDFTVKEPVAPGMTAAQYEEQANAARTDMARRNMAIQVAADPERFGFSMNRFFAEGGEVEGRELPELPGREDVSFIRAANKQKMDGKDLENLMLGIGFDKKAIVGANLSRMSEGERDNLARSLMAAYNTNFGDLGVNAAVIRPIDAPPGVYMGTLGASYPLGQGRIMGGVNALRTPDQGTQTQGYSLGYAGKVGPGFLEAQMMQPKDFPQGRSGRVQYRIPFADGGEVEGAASQMLKQVVPMDARIFGSTLFGSRDPITEKNFTADELAAMQKAVDTAVKRTGQAQKGSVQYVDYPRGEQIGPDFKPVGQTLGRFTYEKQPDGTTVIRDRYDFYNEGRAKNIEAYEKMGGGEKALTVAGRALKNLFTGNIPGIPQELGDAYIGRQGRDVTIQLPPVRRAEGSPEGGETVDPRKMFGMRERQEPKREFSWDELVSVTREGLRNTPRTPFGMGLEMGYKGYKYLTGTQPLEDLLERARRANQGHDPHGGMEPIRRSNGGDTEPTPEERAAASKPAFLTPKSGIGRRTSTRPGEIEAAVLQGVSETPYNLLGAPVDLATMVMRPFGYDVQAPTGGSEWIKQKMSAAGVRPQPPTQPTQQAFYELGQLGGSLINPAAPVRGAVAGAQATGKAAKALMKDFQEYNRALDVPGASYAVKPRGGHFEMAGQTFGDIDKTGQPVESVKNYVETTLAITNDHPLNEWMRNKVGAYLRRDMGTEMDQFVKAADEGKKLHFVNKPIGGDYTGPHMPSWLRNMRKAEGFPEEGTAKTPYGQKVEMLTDRAVDPIMLEDAYPTTVPPGIKQFVETDPTMRMYGLNFTGLDELQLPELRNKMSQMRKMPDSLSFYGQPAVKVPERYMFTDQALQGLTPAQASERVAQFDAWKQEAKQRMASRAALKDPNVDRIPAEGGGAWINPPDLEQNPALRELIQDVGCDGGWCTNKESMALSNGSGNNRLTVLMDKNARPRAQMTITTIAPDTDDFLLSMGDAEAQAFKAAHPDVARYDARGIRNTPEYQDWARSNPNQMAITEIKGVDNEIDLSNTPYLKQVQDRVKQLDAQFDLASVDNLEGIGLTEIPRDSPYDMLKHFNLPVTTRSPYGDPVGTRRLLKDKFGSEKDGLQAILDEAIKMNGGSKYFSGNEDEISDLFHRATGNILGPEGRATGGMIERRTDDSRKYL